MQPPTIIRSDDLRNENRRRLLQMLRAAGPCPPGQLSDLTGLSAASISTLSTQMIAQGILNTERVPVPSGKTSRGRPRSQLTLNAAAGHIVTLTLTIDCIVTRLMDYGGQVSVEKQQHLDTRALDRNALLDRLCQCIDEVLVQRHGIFLHHIGVAFQGVTEHETGTLSWSPIIGVRNVPLGKVLRDRYGVSVSVNNDCRLISDALSRRHAESLSETFATVLFSHGIGLALYLKGQPFAGTRTSALEMGHLRFEHNGAICRCGKNGCIEAYAADYGIYRMTYGDSIQDPPIGRVSDEDMQRLISEAHSGSIPAIQAFEIAGAAIGDGLASLFTLLDPMPVALVGHDDAAFDLIRKGIKTTLDAHLDGSMDSAELLHCYNDEDPLLARGLADVSLGQVDLKFADQHVSISTEATDNSNSTISTNG